MNTRICIGIPSNGTVKTRTLFAITRMLNRSPLKFEVLTHDSCYIHVNREALVKRAIEGGFSHILFIDSDMFFDTGSAEQLLNRDKDIIGADYNYRELPLRGTLKELEGEEEPINGLKKCAGIATGFLMIKTSVFKKLKHPWFFYEMDENGLTVQGDDIWFCNRAREAGFDIWCDTTVNIKHIGEYLF